MNQGSPKLGVFFDLRNPSGWRRPWAEHYERSIEIAVEAERLGAASAWVSEHHLFEDGYMPQPLTFLAALAARTERMRLGTAIVVAPLRHPRHLAEQAAVVDLISDGRVEIGMGAGSSPAEYKAFGVASSNRYDLTDAATIEVRDLLWGGQLNPPPVQDRLPIWLGYQGPKGARRAGRLGVGLLSTDRDLLDPYRAGLVDGGHDPSSARMGGVINLIVSSDPDRAAARLAPFLHHQMASYVASRAAEPPFSPVDSAPPDFLVDDLTKPQLGGNRMVVANVDDALRILRERTAGAPVHHAYLWASVSGMPDDMVVEHLNLVFGEIAPRLANSASA